jgi:ornithine cyclodeaminase
MMQVRKIRRVRVASQAFDRAKRFADRETSRRGLDVEAVRTVREAVEGADIICSATSAREPIVKGAWLSAGTHINAVGSSVPTARELDTAAVVAARLFVDRRESALNEAGDFLIPKSEGAIGDDHIVGEIGEILTGVIPGRRSSDEITLFKSLGLAVEDVASARHIYDEARRTGKGRFVPFGGSRHDAD